MMGLMAQGGELAGAGRGEKKTPDEFERAMRRIYERAKTEAGYNVLWGSTLGAQTRRRQVQPFRAAVNDGSAPRTAHYCSVSCSAPRSDLRRRPRR